MIVPPKRIKKKQEKIRRLTGTAISEYAMIEEGDRILVACSGGKDSTVLLLVLDQIRKNSPISFTLTPVMVDQKQPGFYPDAYKKWLAEQGFDLRIVQEDTYSIITEINDPHKKHCSLCARLRRGILYTYAAQNGFTKIALGHHRDDINETFLLNIFFEGTLATMPPFLRTQDKRNTIIRPLCNVPESYIYEYSQAMAFPTVPCGSCQVYENIQRREIKHLLQELEKKHPRLNASILAALKNVKPSHLLDVSLAGYNKYDKE